MRRRLFSQKTVRDIAAFASFAVLVSCNCNEREYGYKRNPHAKAPRIEAEPAPAAEKAPEKPGKGRAPRGKPRAKAPKADKCPEEMAMVDSFCIDRWEIHLVHKEDGSVHPREKPPYRVEQYKAVSSGGVYPQGYMSQDMARTACKNAGKELCSLNQWQKACRGTGKHKYPYGNDYQQTTCNVGYENGIQDNIVILPERPHILDFLNPPPENATLQAYKAHHVARPGKLFNDPQAALEPGYLAKTGSYTGCVSSGWSKPVYDMDGNLSEWISKTKRTRKGFHAVFMADGHSGTAQLGCEREVAGHNREYHDYSMGTRCCKRAK